MLFESALTMPILVAGVLCFLDSRHKWGRREAHRLLIVGVVYGAGLPLVAVHVYGAYGFRLHLTLAGIPLALPVFWYVVLYGSSVLGGRIRPRRGPAVLGPLCAGAVLMAMEIVWDTALVTGNLIVYRTSGLTVLPFGLPPFLVLAHFVIGFVHESLCARFRRSRQWNSLPASVAFSLGAMALLSIPLAWFPHGLFLELQKSTPAVVFHGAYLAAMVLYAAGIAAVAYPVIFGATRLGSASSRPAAQGLEIGK